MSPIQVVHLINRGLYVLSAFLIFIVTCMIVFDVGGRGLFNAPLTGTVEIVSNIIVVIAFLQLSYAIQTGGMFHTTMLLDRLPDLARRSLILLAELTGAALFALMIYASWEPMLHAWRIGEYYGGGEFRFPVYPVRSILVLSCALACINYLMRAWLVVTGAEVETTDVEGLEA